MADHEWYYADHEQQQGPVGKDALVQRLTKGRLAADTLVWHEGLDDWAPANEVNELLGGQSVPPPPVQPASSAAGTTSAPGAPPTQAPVVTAAGSWQKYLAGRRAGGKPLDPLQYVRLIGQPLILVGLCVVLLARGCDSIGNRYVARLEAKSQLAAANYQDDTQRRERQIEADRNAVREDEALTEDVRARELQTLSQRLEEWTETRQTERRDLQEGAWSRLATAARNAEGNNTLWAFWRETAFVLGTVLLAVGLVAVGFSRTGPERWVCLVMLAIIVFSLYVGGIAWLGSMAVPAR